MKSGSLESQSEGCIRDAGVMEHFLNDQQEFKQDNSAPSSADEDEERFEEEPRRITESQCTYLRSFLDMDFGDVLQMRLNLLSLYTLKLRRQPY
jgi:hypothetical protein